MNQAASVTSLADWATGEGKEVSSFSHQSTKNPKEFLSILLKVGVVTTTRLTHATPGAMYSHSPMRDWEADINLPTDSVGCTDIATQVCLPTLYQHQHLSFHRQLIESMEDGKLVVALGGGRRNFQTVENGGRRSLKDLVNRFSIVKHQINTDVQP